MFGTLLKSKPPTAPKHFSLNINGRDISIFLKRNARAKRLILRQDRATGLFSLTLPKRAKLDVAEHFIHTHKGWIAEQLSKNSGAQKFDADCSFLLHGHEHVIIHDKTRLRGLTQQHNNTVVIYGDHKHIHRRMVDFLRKDIRTFITPLAHEKASIIDKKIKKIRIADQKTRWGSCSTSGTLSFSCRLVFAPIFVIDYVVAHETAHLLHMNHSREFWDTCRSLCENGHQMDDAKEWLKNNNDDLTKYCMTR